MAVKKGLGKGLGALIAAEEKLLGNQGGIEEVDINKIEPNANQPRRSFPADTLEELSESIKEFGVIMPIILRVHPETEGFYSIVAGERRWRAARLAQLKTIPAIIRDYDEMQTLQIALIENIQRENLTPIEEAICYSKLTDIFFFTIEGIAQKVGKSRNTISSFLSLLKLDLRVQNMIAGGQLLLGHAKLLMEFPDGDEQFGIALAIAETDSSIREAKNMIERYKRTNRLEKEKKERLVNISKYVRLENELHSSLGTRVSIKEKKKDVGKIEINYYSAQDLDRLIGILKSGHR